MRYKRFIIVIERRVNIQLIVTMAQKANISLPNLGSLLANKSKKKRLKARLNLMNSSITIRCLQLNN